MGILLFSLFSLFGTQGLTCLQVQGVLEVASNTSVLKSGDQLIMSDQGLFLDSIARPFAEVDRAYFSNRKELIALLDCHFEFSDVSVIEKGFVQYCNSGEGELNLVLVHFPNIDRIDIVQGGLRWFTSRCLASDDTTPQLAIPTQVGDTATLEYITSYGDSIGYILEPPTFEPVTEQLLVKDAALTPAITPAVLELVSEQVLLREENLCKDIETEYELWTEQVLERDAYTDLTVTEAIWDSVTEEIQLRPSYTNYEIVQPTFEQDIRLVLAYPEQYLYDMSWSGDCELFGVDCIDYTYEYIPEVDTLLAIEVPVCPDGYSVTPLCIKEIVEPALYTTVGRAVLVELPSFESVEVPAVYGTREFIRIKSETEIPDSCIEIIYETRQYERLAVPAFGTFMQLEAEFITVTSEILNTPAALQIEAPVDKLEFAFVSNSYLASETLIPAIDTVFVTEQVWIDIANALVDRAYLEPAHALIRDSVYKSLYEYMLEEQYYISAINEKLLAGLGVSLENDLEVDSLISTLTETSFVELVNYPLKFLVSVCNGEYKLDRVSEIAFDEFQEVLYDIPDVGMVRFRQEPGKAEIRAAKANSGVLETVIDLGLTACDEAFRVPSICGGPLDIPIRQVGIDAEGRRYVEFDILLDDCLTAEDTYFRFIEGIGTNAGLWYEIVEGKVISQLQCATSTESQVMYEQAEGVCGLATAIDGESTEQAAVLLFPNPATDRVSVQSGWTIMYLIDATGRKIGMSPSTEEINVSDLSPNVYTVVLTNKNGQVLQERLVVY